jgi:hypothetical protein
MKTPGVAIIGFIFSLILTGSAAAETLMGVIRNVNCGSHSFGLDVPPMTRVYFNEGTTFATSAGGNTCHDVQEGDQAEVEGKTQRAGVFLAKNVKTLGNLPPVENLAANEIKIKLDQSFLMGVSQVAVLKENGKTKLKISTTEFINTLCKGYDCSGEGEVGMRMKVGKGLKDNDILLTSKNARKPATPVQAEIYGYTIQLLEAGEDTVVLVVRKS